eukprot:TRINITY_DN2356_c2_g3_i1.p6 TRINITY_DN2356_c2_g3~~TRINITY_DN2356_c2_g3_i1.p6  ORF type:complete len:101 (-),score=3.20 TRINITY_DN2356_c2_g3_i1:949-1251(-)
MVMHNSASRHCQPGARCAPQILQRGKGSLHRRSPCRHTPQATRHIASAPMCSCSLWNLVVVFFLLCQWFFVTSATHDAEIDGRKVVVVVVGAGAMQEKDC